MGNYENLIKSANGAQVRPIPQWAKSLIYDLARALDAQIRYAEGIKNRAAGEVDEARKQLAGDLPDADTFVSMPRSVTADETYDVTWRPLGAGVTVQFRGPDDDEDEGIDVKIKDGVLHVESLSRLKIVPSYGGNIEIEAD
jgi:hypothetical protein